MDTRKIKALLVVAFGYLVFNGFTLNPLKSNVVSSENKEKSVELVVLNEKAPVEIQYGDENPMEELLESVDINIKSKHEEVTYVGFDELHKQKYVTGNKEILLSGYDAKKLDLKEVQLEVRTTNGKLQDEDNVKRYRVLVHLIDKVAPEITLAKEEAEITVGDDFDIDEYIESITDKEDGELDAYTVDDENVDLSEPGEYTYKITASDKANNVTVKEFKVTVKAKEVPVVHADGSVTYSRPAPSGSRQGDIYNAAMAQLGRYQDCTMLVTNALGAVGINFHDWPAGYMSLGTQVSAGDAVPGDLVYYANGGTGLAHIAVYAGNGQAIHGGYLGSQTVVASANVGSGPVYIRVR